MTAPAGAASACPDLEPLRQRLVSGIAAALATVRLPGAGTSDRHAIATAGLGDRLVGLGRASRKGRGQFGTELDALAAFLGSNRPCLLSVLYSPAQLLDSMPTLRRMPAADPVSRWQGLCWCAESAWRCIAGEVGSPDLLAPGDRELLLPVAARLRFLALSEPFRRRPAYPPWAPDDPDEDSGPVGRVGETFGAESWHVLFGACLLARWRWLDCLNRYQSYPLLAMAVPPQLEAELTWLVFHDAKPLRPLIIAPAPLDQPSVWTSDDTAVVAEVLERHLLPRFRLGQVTQLAAVRPPKGWRPASAVLNGWRGAAQRMKGILARSQPYALLVTGLAVAAAAGVAIAGYFTTAAWLAVASYALIGGGSLGFGPRWAAPWLLRLPAASAVGLFALVTLAADWWQRPRVAAAACTALTLAAVGYLLVELRNHDVTGGRALGRGLGVAAIGTVHALLISLIGLVLVAPAFAQAGTPTRHEPTRLTQVWTQAQPGQAWTVLALSSCWCLAVGVFSQILWDDRPITAPLAHLQWR
jgi:hypothetical protein